MKKIFLISLISLSFFSCDEDKDYIGDSNKFVSFSNTNVLNQTISENVGNVDLRIGLSSIATSDVTISFVATDDTAIQGTHYSLPSSIVIPKGEQFGNLNITIIDDADLNAKRDFELLISSVSDDSYVVGIVEEPSFKKKISILNDDCTTNFSFWTGALNVENVGSGFTSGTGNANEQGDCNILIVDNDLAGLGGADVNTLYSLSFTSTSPDGMTGTVRVNPTSIANRTLSGTLYDLKYFATGTYDSVSGTITLNYTVLVFSLTSGAYLGGYYSGTNIITLL